MCQSPGLVAYWKFDESDGTAVSDSSAYKNTGTVYNNPIRVIGKFNSSLQFNGSNYVEVPDSASLDLSSQVTIAAWINPSSISVYNRIVAKSHTSDAAPWTMYGLMFDDSNHARMEITTGGVQYVLNGQTIIPLNTWTFVAGTYDGSTMKLYVNGNLDNYASHSGPIDTNSMPLSIARSGFNSNYFKGIIDEVKIWNRSISAGEIQSQYSSTPSACSSTCKAQSFSTGTCEAGTTSGKPYNITSALHTDGSAIKNDCGDTVFLRGVGRWNYETDTSGFWTGSWQVWDENTLRSRLQLLKSWGLNEIRLHTVADWWLQGYDNYTYNLKRTVQIAQEEGVYVVFDLVIPIDGVWAWKLCYEQNLPQYCSFDSPSLPFSPYSDADLNLLDLSQTNPDPSTIIRTKQDFAKYWANVSIQLKVYPNVIFDLYNEPWEGSASNASVARNEWFDAAQQAITAIRNTGSQNLIILEWTEGEVPNYGEGFTWINASLDSVKDPLNDIVYSGHFYRHAPIYLPSWDVAETYDGAVQALQSMQTDYVVNTLHKPLFIGEIGAYSEVGDDEYNKDLLFLKNVLDICNNWGISYSAWSWSGTDADYGLFNSDGSPTPSGQVLKDAVASGGTSISNGGCSNPNACQSKETSIGQVGCMSETCCCL